MTAVTASTLAEQQIVHGLPEQPDGITDDSRDLPDPRVAAVRVRDYIAANGDGLYDIANGEPLYARDLEAITRAVLAATPAQTA